jgi:hypothetical protein
VVNATTPALRITQTGTGNALEVEDSANPDATPFVVTAAGDVGIGTNTPTSIGSSKVVEISSTAGNSGFLLFSVAGSLKGSVYANASETSIGSISATPLLLKTGDTTKATLDSSGNLGLGVTPSAKLEIYSTNNAFNALQVRYNGSNDAMGFGIGNSNGFPYLGYNTKSQAAVDGPVYERSGPAAQLRMDNGSFKFNIAPSGTANTTTITNGVSYTIITSGNQTDFGAANNNVGTSFTATSSGTLSSGTVSQNISFTQAMTLDASGNLVIGDTTAGARLHVSKAGAGTIDVAWINNAQAVGANVGSRLVFTGTTNNNGLAAVSGAFEGATTADGGYMTLATRAVTSGTLTERARITSGGYFKASNTGAYYGAGATYHEFNNDVTDQPVTLFRASNSSYADIAIQVFVARNTTNNTFYALSYYNEGAGAYKFRVADSGDVTNTNGTYGTISDQKLKQDIVDAGSQWSDIKALRFRKFKMKDDPSGLVQLGVVAQEVELTSPGLVDEHTDRDAEGNDLGTTTKSVKTSVLLMKAAVALQEAMARIETLEAKIAALEAK